ncbi:MAG: hypothetical protein PHV06_07700 [bacterium]|nr:hypothetical protein [bacterium]
MKLFIANPKEKKGSNLDLIFLVKIIIIFCIIYIISNIDVYAINCKLLKKEQRNPFQIDVLSTIDNKYYFNEHTLELNKNHKEIIFQIKKNEYKKNYYKTFKSESGDYFLVCYINYKVNNVKFQEKIADRQKLTFDDLEPLNGELIFFNKDLEIEISEKINFVFLKNTIFKKFFFSFLNNFHITSGVFFDNNLDIIVFSIKNNILLYSLKEKRFKLLNCNFFLSNVIFRKNEYFIFTKYHLMKVNYPFEIVKTLEGKFFVCDRGIVQIVPLDNDSKIVDKIYLYADSLDSKHEIDIKEYQFLNNNLDIRGDSICLWKYEDNKSIKIYEITYNNEIKLINETNNVRIINCVKNKSNDLYFLSYYDKGKRKYEFILFSNTNGLVYKESISNGIYRLKEFSGQNLIIFDIREEFIYKIF